MHHQSCGTSSMLRTGLAEPVQINTLNSLLNNDLTIIDILVVLEKNSRTLWVINIAGALITPMSHIDIYAARLD